MEILNTLLEFEKNSKLLKKERDINDYDRSNFHLCLFFAFLIGASYIISNYLSYHLFLSLTTKVINILSIFFGFLIVINSKKRYSDFLENIDPFGAGVLAFILSIIFFVVFSVFQYAIYHSFFDVYSFELFVKKLALFDVFIYSPILFIAIRDRNRSKNKNEKKYLEKTIKKEKEILSYANSIENTYYSYFIAKKHNLENTQLLLSKHMIPFLKENGLKNISEYEESLLVSEISRKKEYNMVNS